MNSVQNGVLIVGAISPPLIKSIRLNEQRNAFARSKSAD